MVRSLVKESQLFNYIDVMWKIILITKNNSKNARKEYIFEHMVDSQKEACEVLSSEIRKAKNLNRVILDKSVTYIPQ